MGSAGWLQNEATDDRLWPEFGIIILTMLGTVKDWADLVHALAWPAVALTAIILFRKSVNNGIADILAKIPWERITSMKLKGAELRMARDARIPFGEVPKIPQGKEKEPEPEATS